MIWGMAGMLIVVPVLAILKIIMQHFDELKPFAFLISDEGVSNHQVKLRWKWWIWSRRKFKLLGNSISKRLKQLIKHDGK
jgi:hypothetical protein